VGFRDLNFLNILLLFYLFFRHAARHKILHLVLGCELTGLFNCAVDGQRHGLMAWGMADWRRGFLNGDAISPGLLVHAIAWTDDRIQVAHTYISLGAQRYSCEDELRAFVGSVGSVQARTWFCTSKRSMPPSAVWSCSRLDEPRIKWFCRVQHVFLTVVFVREWVPHLHFPPIHGVDKHCWPSVVAASLGLSAQAL
jgi:hypothetical protein